MKADIQRKLVRERYGGIAAGAGDGCCSDDGKASGIAKTMGYGDDELKGAEEANLGLGCGNPTAIAGLQEGETVLDLGSGAGFDAFLARKKVGESGAVIGVDMTHEMIEKSRHNACKQGYGNVAFRLGEIENLPVADATIDVVISNCVINLSPEKERVFKEVYRVLKPGGRINISDIVRGSGQAPESAYKDPQVCNCIIGAERMDKIELMLKDAGFSAVQITKTTSSDDLLEAWKEGDLQMEDVVSATIHAVKR
ncbi:arsenite methyltransferase [Salipaludibacillus aurantiacus]|uniref:Arsenite methyltransferase n=1 Tax=Salipaludibacillus aurantiacus TaxID=1601833 RepID=A0A1H9W8N9_9BACI|nr:arsenite methyltransferase [Salipaludibacillus aurantiacus]SES30037.1 Ubiquinone/menaquinone biosynthesis C-methylase UbiE [Salipaludibacillus aurantiacus]